MSMKLPEGWTATNIEKAKGSRMYGVPVEDLTRDELLACVGFLMADMRQTREQHSSDFETLRSLRGEHSSTNWLNLRG